MAGLKPISSRKSLVALSAPLTNYTDLDPIFSGQREFPPWPSDARWPSLGTQLAVQCLNAPWTRRLPGEWRTRCATTAVIRHHGLLAGAAAPQHPRQTAGQKQRRGMCGVPVTAKNEALLCQQRMLLGT